MDSGIHSVPYLVKTGKPNMTSPISAIMSLSDFLKLSYFLSDLTRNPKTAEKKQNTYLGNLMGRHRILSSNALTN